MTEEQSRPDPHQGQTILGGHLQPDRYPRRGRGALSLWHPARSGSRCPGHERQFPDGGDQCGAAQERGKEAEGVNWRRIPESCFIKTSIPGLSVS
jgi:hypothetical protein